MRSCSKWNRSCSKDKLWSQLYVGFKTKFKQNSSMIANSGSGCKKWMKVVKVPTSNCKVRSARQHRAQ